jgi:hypothetical protein
MVSMRLVRRSSTSCLARGHRLLVQGTRVVPPSSTAPRRALSVLALLATVLVAPVLLAAPASAAPPTVSPSSSIEALAPHQGQAICDPVARPGAVALRQLVLQHYPGTGDSGIVRACTAAGASEHKEGRAWDWRVTTANPTHVTQVAEFTSWLLAPDEHGNTAAMARRLGIMYMIWDAKIWKSYQADKGWQRYTGASPHTDHVHFSLSWAGAYAKTSYWTGSVAPVMPGPVPPPTAAPAKPGGPPITDRALQRRVVVDRAPGPWRRK